MVVVRDCAGNPARMSWKHFFVLILVMQVYSASLERCLFVSSALLQGFLLIPKAILIKTSNGSIRVEMSILKVWSTISSGNSSLLPINIH